MRKTACRPFIAVEKGIEVEALVQCSKCSYRAVDPRGLKVHVSRIHTGRGPLECPCCDFRADEMDKLTRHVCQVAQVGSRGRGVRPWLRDPQAQCGLMSILEF